ncbi:Nucleolar_protein NOP5 [Hexamita inflata]|uniref:Nucleolar protein NOP5 n=1 Tax=Hexamita inflata TaxID=28002 RepID=A0AA86TY47_9EUKA|nr:Nucleolar protein NOP5 [Hexamita inflata]
MYYLYETATGLSLFKCEQNAPSTLVTFHPYETIQQAFEQQKSVLTGELTTVMQEFMKSNYMKTLKSETLGVADAHLAQALKDKFEIKTVCNDLALQVHREIQKNLFKLIPKLNQEKEKQYQASLAHNFSRYQIQFNSESIDSMILQSVNLLDESEKEINNYVMRLMEWAVWSFPECSKVVTDHKMYCKVMAIVGGDKNSLLNPETLKMLEFLPKAEVEKLVQLSMHSVGTEITSDDATRIRALASEIMDLYETSDKMEKYITERMFKIAPNYTRVVGPIVGAKLLAKAGSLLKLAKAPASTIQILGAEATLFKALKAKAKTPKYGFLYNCEMVTDASVKDKGKVARKIAQNAAICVRYDALHEGELADISEVRIQRCQLEKSKQTAKLQKVDKLTAYKVNVQEMKEAEKVEVVKKGVVVENVAEKKSEEKKEKKEKKEEKKSEEKEEKKSEEKKEKKDKEEKKEKKDKEEKEEKKEKKDKEEKKEKKDKEEKEEKKEKKDKEEKKEKKDKEEKEEKKEKKDKKDKEEKEEKKEKKHKKHDSE